MSLASIAAGAASSGLASGISNAVGSFGGTVGNILSGITGGYFQRKQMKRQYQYQRQLMNEQYALNLQQWNRENEYNSPASQMARLKEAGLNTNLMYGDGSAGNAGSFQVGTPGAPSGNVTFPRGDVGISPLASAQEEYYRALTKKTNNDSLLSIARTALMNSQKVGIDFENDLNSLTKDSLRALRDNAATYSGLRNTATEWDIEGRQLSNIRQSLENDYLFKTLDTRVQREITALDMDREQLENIKAIRGEIYSRTNLNYAQCNKISFEIPLIVSNTLKSEVETKRIEGLTRNDYVAFQKAVLDYVITDQSAESLIRMAKLKAKGVDIDNYVKLYSNELQSKLAHMKLSTGGSELLGSLYGITFNLVNGLSSLF